MKSYNLFDDTEFLLPKGSADFLLFSAPLGECSVHQSIDSALIAEYLVNEKTFSSQQLCTSLSGLPSPAIITRAVHKLAPFKNIEIVDLGLLHRPKNALLHEYSFSDSSKKYNAKEIFAKGMEFGRSYELRGNYLVMANNLTCQNARSIASALALGYDIYGALSFKDEISNQEEKEIEMLLAKISDGMDPFEKLSVIKDTLLLFSAGFLFEATRRFEVVLSGNIHSALMLLVADGLRESMLMRLQASNLRFAITKALAKDPKINFLKLFEQLSYKLNGIYTDFSMKDSEIDLLRKYKTKEYEEDLGVGATLAYGVSHTLTSEDLLSEIELLSYSL